MHSEHKSVAGFRRKGNMNRAEETFRRIIVAYCELCDVYEAFPECVAAVMTLCNIDHIA